MRSVLFNVRWFLDTAINHLLNGVIGYPNAFVEFELGADCAVVFYFPERFLIHRVTTKFRGNNNVRHPRRQINITLFWFFSRHVVLPPAYSSKQMLIAPCGDKQHRP